MQPAVERRNPQAKISLLERFGKIMSNSIARSKFSGVVMHINPGINLRDAAINSNVSVSPRRYYHTYGDIIIHTTTSHTIVRVYNHE